MYGELAKMVEEKGVQVKASQMQEAAYTLLPQGGHAMFLERIGCNKVYSDHFSKTGTVMDSYRQIYHMIAQLKLTTYLH